MPLQWWDFFLENMHVGDSNNIFRKIILFLITM